MRKAFIASAIIIFLSAILFVTSIGQSDSPRGTLKPPAATAQVLVAKNLPLEFIPNAGQTDSRVSFYIKGSDRTVYFTPDGVTLALYKESEADQPKQIKVPAGPGDMDTGSTKSWVVKIDFVGAKKGVEPEGLDKTGAVFSYFKGKREDWRTGLPGYRKIIYRDLWPGIDLVYKGEVGRLKYEFIVAPGADPSLIQLGIQGASDVKVDEEGRLVLKTPLESIVDEKPLVFQERQDGEGKLVGAAYRLEKTSGGEMKVDFSLADYDHSLPLIIDPATLVYCGYIGGSNYEHAEAIAVDNLGSAYITGWTQSDQASFPVAVGPDTTFHGRWEDAYVAKVNASGTGLVYCGYIGGSWEERPYDIAVDGSGNAYITGWTNSGQASFPVTVGPDLTMNGSRDAFVAKINASGTNLVYCGYIGGDGLTRGRGIAVDDLGNAYVAGYTASDQASFPVTVGPDITFNGGYWNPKEDAVPLDAFVAKVNASGTGFIYCGYIGGTGDDIGTDIAVDGSGNAYVTGYTFSKETSFPVTGGPDTTFNSTNWEYYDAFVAKVNASGTGLVYCGYIGGSSDDYGQGIAVDSSGNAYVAGYTASDQASFPVDAGPDTTFNGGRYDAFVAKVNASGTGLVYCGYIGGSESEAADDIAVDGSGNAYITGATPSDQITFPVAGGPDTTYNGFGDVFVAKVEPTGTNFVYCGYVGGSGGDAGSSIDVDSSGNAYITGATSSDQASFPVKDGPDTTYNGSVDVFVAKIPSGLARIADLALAKSANNIAPLVDELVSFTVTATNLGPWHASAVKVADKLPAGLTFLSADATRGTYDPGSGLWTLGSLENENSATMTLRARVDGAGTFTNRAALAGMNESDPDPLNNEASVTMEADYKPYPPSDFQVQRLENDLIFFKEYINRLTWTANPLNRGVILSYRLYRKPKGQPDEYYVFHKELAASFTSFDDRGLKKDDLFVYRLTSVSENGRESDPVEAGNGGVEYKRLAPGPGRWIFFWPIDIKGTSAARLIH
jgi:uncharacterized repeat protein (TIGR01451 family)